MKEIWKLIELLENWDWRNVTYNKQSDWGYMFWLGDLALREERLLSKKFWFIKWLVENDKIDFSKFEYMINIKANKRELYYTKAGFHTEALLMLLSIQDEPIEYLISILK